MPDQLAYIVMGEAGMCGISAMLAVAWLYSRNPIMYGHTLPSPAATWIAGHWQMLADPVPGSIAMFSAHDLELARVQQLINRMRLKPLRRFDCGSGFALIFYGQ